MLGNFRFVLIGFFDFLVEKFDLNKSFRLASLKLFGLSYVRCFLLLEIKALPYLLNEKSARAEKVRAGFAMVMVC